MLDYISIAILALFALLIIQTAILVLVGRKILGTKDPAPLRQAIVGMLSPDPNDSLSTVLKEYVSILTGMSLINFISVSKKLGSISDEESDAINAHLDLILKVVNEFIKPVILSRLTYESSSVEDYRLRAKAITDSIHRELYDAKRNTVYTPYSYYTNQLVEYNARIDGDLDTVASIVIDCTAGFEDHYIEEQLRNRSPSHLDKIKHWRAK